MNVERAKAIITIIVTAVVNIANVYGYAVDAETWINVLFSILSAATILYSWWFNQNCTYAAQQGQLVVNKIKNEQRATRIRAKHSNDAEN